MFLAILFKYWFLPVNLSVKDKLEFSFSFLFYNLYIRITFPQSLLITKRKSSYHKDTVFLYSILIKDWWTEETSQGML